MKLFPTVKVKKSENSLFNDESNSVELKSNWVYSLKYPTEE